MQKTTLTSRQLAVQLEWTPMSFLLFPGIFAFQRLRFVSLIHVMSSSSFWCCSVNIISRNCGFLVRFLLLPLWICHGKWPRCVTVSLSVVNVFQCAAETSSTSFHRYRYSRALLLSLNAPNTALAPDICKRLCSLGIYDRNQACPLWNGQKRPYGAVLIRRGKTVDIINQKHPLSLTRHADKLCSCFAISDGRLPTNLVGHVCSAQLSDRVDQLGISPGSHRRCRPGKKRPNRGGRRQQAGLSPSLSPTNRGPEPFTLSALRLMILSDLSQISAVQHMGYLILTWLKLILVHLFKNFQSILKLCFSMLSQLETRKLTFVTI